ncbi:hypothetical protein NVP1084O_063 [Vibrio phage 1.084.O._10N.261.49.F5]|nr:hypothetical protein NVP1084O_063 [Vibrio phage 1.084.O._10N.261.49.F5]
MKLGEWVETPFYGEDVTHIMYEVFHEDIEYTDVENKVFVATPRIKVKFKDGTESDWYRQPETKLESVKEGYIFGEIKWQKY